MPTKKTVKKTVKKAVKKEADKRYGQKYRATLYVLGRKYIGTGREIVEAIADIKPGIARGRAILAVENVETLAAKERILQPSVVTRLFNGSPTVREIIRKQTSQLFGV